MVNHDEAERADALLDSFDDPNERTEPPDDPTVT
jgi:hypothetical protein